MSQIPVRFISINPDKPSTGYWDQHFLQKLFARPEFVQDTEKDSYSNYGIVVFHADNHVDYVKELNEYLSHYHGVLVIASGDENAIFPIEQLKHPNMKLWLMTPRPDRKYDNVDRFIGEMGTPHTENLPTEAPAKDLKWFFAGQITHKRRVLAMKQLRSMADGELITTDGFAKGLDPKEYMEIMSHARVVPCPGGVGTPDTFRFFEALEAGCIPIADEFCALHKAEGYWQMIFGPDFPFPTIKDWTELPGTVNFYHDTFAQNSNKIFAWWQQQKRQFLVNVLEDFYTVVPVEPSNHGTTVIVPTSPTLLHPDTTSLEETINSIRTHLPSAEIIITFDGIRAEQEALTDNYREYVRRVLWMCNRKWTNVVPIVFDEHMHQVAMAREAMKYVRTDLVLYVEHDTPLTPDMEIPWGRIADMIRLKYADLVRFHFEAFIPKEHEQLMIDKEPQIVCATPVVRTIQWSQRPHLASTEFYNRILADHFSPDARTFVEDKMHSVVIDAYKREQLQGWNKFKLWIYHPEGNIKRSYHTDARAGEAKYSMKF